MKAFLRAALAALTVAVLALLASCGQTHRNPVFTIDEDGNLIVEYENGDKQMLGNVREDEDTGEQSSEKNIVDAELNAAGELILTFSDGSSVNLGAVRQESPEDTDTGEESEGIRITDAQIVNGYLVLTFSDRFHVTVGKVSGSDGRKIESIEIIDGIWYIRYTDGSAEPVAEPVFEESGSISSTVAKNLTLRAEWEAVSYDWETAEVTVRVELECWSISVGAREDEYAGSVTLDGVTQTFETQAINNLVNEQKKFRFATLSFEVELEPDAPTDLELEVSWPFNGRYAGQQVGTLKAAGLIALPGPASTGSTGADTSGEDVPKDANVPQDADVPGGQRRVLSVWRKERDA